MVNQLNISIEREVLLNIKCFLHGPSNSTFITVKENNHFIFC